MEPRNREKLVPRRGNFRKLGRSGGAEVVPGFRGSKDIRVMIMNSVVDVG
jgi:hypothetical protein